MVAGLAVLSAGFASAILSVLPTTFSVRVVDVETDLGIPNADVWLGVVTHVTFHYPYGPDYPIPRPEGYTIHKITDESGLARFNLTNDMVGLLVMVNAEGYTSDCANIACSYYNPVTSDPSEVSEWLVELRPGELPTPPASSGDLTIEITDKNSGLGIANASVCIFDEDNVQIDMKITDSSGVVVFEDLSGFYRVGVVAEGYTSDYAKDEFSYFGAAGVHRDITYPIVLSPVDIASEVSKMGASLWMIVGGAVALVGGGFIAYVKWLDQD